MYLPIGVDISRAGTGHWLGGLVSWVILAMDLDEILAMDLDETHKEHPGNKSKHPKEGQAGHVDHGDVGDDGDVGVY